MLGFSPDTAPIIQILAIGLNQRCIDQLRHHGVGEFWETTMIGKLKRYARCTSAGISPIFAVAVVPVILSVGVAVDYARHLDARTELLAALDGAALAAAQIKNGTPAAREAYAKIYFAENFNIAEIPNAVADVVVSNSSVTVSADLEMSTSFMRLAGINTMSLYAESEASLRTQGNAELVLVLDYSGSMNGNQKYKRMADAAVGMLNSLETVAGDIDFKVGLVPFSAMVRTSMPAGYVSPPSAGSTWTGCTQDRAYPYNIGISTPTSDPATKWGYFDNSSENNGSYNCTAYNNKHLNVRPLTADLDSIRTQLDNMRPLGNTNISLGTEFGWNLLDPALPFDEAKPYNEANNRKFLVLLTDGVQTSKGYGPGDTRSVANARSNLTALCAGMRATNITIFSIAYDVTDPAVTELLANCAPGRYYEPAVGSDALNAVFTEITNQISDDMVRLTK
jgi:Mg-chelatase subunit ChlD